MNFVIHVFAGIGIIVSVLAVRWLGLFLHQISKDGGTQ